jgi:hypothetical protein
VFTVVFWNVNEKAAALRHLPCLAASEGVDAFLLAECGEFKGQALLAAAGLAASGYREAENGVSKVRALTRLAPVDFIHRFSTISGDLAVWTFRAPGLLPPGEILLAGVHLLSKAGGASEVDQAMAATEVIRELNGVEDGRGHRYTALVGDFNMHPYDQGMTSVAGFHALMTRKLTEADDRRYRRQDRRRFYNPMWGLFGDRSPGPAGTYHWVSSVAHNPHWAMLDQILLRKDMMNRLTDLRILDGDGVHRLVDGDDFPDAELFSDHLPVLFRLDV